MTRKRAKTDVIEFFVSPQGNDSWSGKFPAPNKGKTNGPFATIKAAQQAIRKLRKGAALKQPVRVYLREGFYFLKRPLVFLPKDSGTLEMQGIPRKWNLAQDNTIVYEAYHNETPVISGGCRIGGWKEQKLNNMTVWVANVPEVKRGKWYFRQLWVNGQRRHRPRLPQKGFYRVEKLARQIRHKGHAWSHGDDRFIYNKGDISADWQNLQDIEVVLFNYWVDSHMWCKRIDDKKRLLVMDRRSRNSLMDDKPVNGERIGACYRVENVFEELKNPGEWYLDRHIGKLFYIPMPGEEIRTAEIIAPRLEQLVQIRGKSLDKNPVQDICFRDITFAHTEWTFAQGVASSNQAANEAPGAISINDAKRIRFDHCTIANVGTYGVECLDATRDIAITNCRITDLGAGGVKVWHGCRRTLIADNEISDGGHVFHAGVGVLIGQSSGNRIIHNHVRDFDYTGISVGWHWGYDESHGYGNIIEYNHIHDIGRGMLSDMGAIYTLGVSPGTRIRYNLIHDIWSRTYGGWGIYPDEGSSFILIENNLVFRTKCGGFHQHYGQENVVRNNIFSFGHENQLHRTRVESHDSFIFEKNLTYFTEGDVWTGSWTENRAIIRNNLYFDPMCKKLVFSGMTIKQWQARGLDVASLIADPRFVNPAKGNFRLKKNSPAFKLGFVEFDLSTVGPRP